MIVKTEATWSDVHLAVVDVEGNGRQPPEIIEICIVQMEGLTVGRTATWLLKPANSITWQAKQIHGISNADVENCPSWADIASDVREMLADRILVAHNASVELGVLKPLLPSWVPLEVLDTLKLARRLRPELSSHSLDALLSEYGIRDAISSQVSSERHRAAYDTIATAHLLIALAHSTDGKVIPYEELVRRSARQETDQQRELF